MDRWVGAADDAMIPWCPRSGGPSTMSSPDRRGGSHSRGVVRYRSEANHRALLAHGCSPSPGSRVWNVHLESSRLRQLIGSHLVDPVRNGLAQLFVQKSHGTRTSSV